MDKKEARSILGVNKDAGRNDIEKRYAVLLKKYRIEINRLKAAEQETADEQAGEQPEQTNQQKAIDEQTGEQPEQTNQQKAIDGQAGQQQAVQQPEQTDQQKAIDGQAGQQQAVQQQPEQTDQQKAIDGQAGQQQAVQQQPEQTDQQKAIDEQAEQAVQQQAEQAVQQTAEGTGIEGTAAAACTGTDSAIKAEFDRVTEAYNVLMGYETKEKEEAPGKAAPLFKMAGIDEKKARNFFYYYKFYILAIILLIGFVIYSVNSCTNRVVPDFNAAFIGRIGYTEATKTLKDSIKAGIPIIKEPGIDGAYIDKTIQGEQLYAMEMKLVVLTAAADIDVFILDKGYYERFAKQGLFISLDEIAPGLGVDISKNQELVLAIEDFEDLTDTEGNEASESSSAEVTQESTSETPHLYGIDVTNSTVLKESGVIADNMIVAVPLATKHQDKAEAFLKFLLN